MRFLIDSQILLWAALTPEKLSARVRKSMRDSENEFEVSIVSLWEIAIKRSMGKLDVPDELFSDLTQHGFGLLSLRSAHVQGYMELPLIHRDPFDRILVAQAQIESLTLVTTDRRIAEYGVPVFN